MEKQYVEKPYKVRAEQYDPAQVPAHPAVHDCSGLAPHVHVGNGVVILTPGDWIYTDLFHESYQVMHADEFAARFGGGAELEAGG